MSDEGDALFVWREIADGQFALVDRAFAQYLDHPGSAPDPAMLDDVLGRAVAVRVFDDGAADGKPFSTEPVLTTTDHDEVAELTALLRIRPGGRGHCMCHGDAAFELLDAAGESLAVLGLHHAEGLRWDVWGDDAELERPLELVRWLADHGYDAPLRQAEADAEAERERAALRADWLDAAPKSVRKLVAGRRERDLSNKVERRIRKEFPDPVDRAAAMLRWFGSGSGRCSGYPSYEEIPEPLLLATPLSLILDALDRSPDDPRLWLGATRLLVGWDFGKERGSERALVPPAVQTRLLAIADADDDDMRGRGGERVRWRVGCALSAAAIPRTIP